MKVGDLVTVYYKALDEREEKWIGICTWTDGYKYSFFRTDGTEVTWTKHDLAFVAEVLDESG